MRRPWIAALALAAAGSSCRPSGPPPAIPVEMADCVPPGALLLAGAKLDSLRASPLYERLPASARGFLEPLHDASAVLGVFNGTDLLLIAHGRFRQAAPGATLVGPDLMLSGSQALVKAAMAQRRSGGPGSRDLLAQASAEAEGRVLWIAARGRVNLPLAGDLDNINRFLRLADFATVGLRLEAPAGIDLAAQCPTPEAAQHLEESLRAILSLSVLGAARQPQIAAMLRSADVRREQSEVHATLAAPPDAMPQLLEHFWR